MDEQIKTYYKYEYTFGEDLVYVQEFEDWQEYAINIVNTWINRLGASKFLMFSDSADNKELFMKGISEILSNDMDATYRAYELSSGRFNQFLKFGILCIVSRWFHVECFRKAWDISKKSDKSSLELSLTPRFSNQRRTMNED